MSQKLIEKEEEYQVGNPAMFVHNSMSCMSTLEPIQYGVRGSVADYILEWDLNGKTALVVDGVRVLIDEAP